MIQRSLFAILVVVGGAFGGALFSVPLSSAIQKIPGVSEIPWFNTLTDRAVIINKTEQVVVEQSEAIDRARAKVVPALVAVTSLRDGVVLASGQGMTVGSDGLVLVRREWIAAGSDTISVTWNTTTADARMVKQSEKDGLVLLKVDATNLPVVSLANVEERLGSFVFLIGLRQATGGQRAPFVNAGIVKSVEGKIMTTNIGEEFQGATGAPLVSLTGEVVGIGAIDSSGHVFAVAASAIRDFLYNEQTP
ncbi:MAG: trypsin-like peptidase domain-containing protein [Patescibacteria group bacterium]